MKDDIGGSCSMRGRGVKCIQKGRDHSEDLGTDGKIILEWIFGK
jgi:hypothetical protein